MTRVLRALWPPLLFGAVFLLVWESIVRGFDVEPFLLPAPSDIWSAFLDRSGDVWDSTFQTGMNAPSGRDGGRYCRPAPDRYGVRTFSPDQRFHPLRRG